MSRAYSHRDDGLAEAADVYHEPHIRGRSRFELLPTDPTEPVYLVLHGERFGPYARSFAENLRRCHTIKADFAAAFIEPTGQPGQRAMHPNRRYTHPGNW